MRLGRQLRTACTIFCTVSSERKTIDDLAEQGVKHESAESTGLGQTGPLAGKTLVVTGTLEKYGREEIEELIAKLGGRRRRAFRKAPDLFGGRRKGGEQARQSAQAGRGRGSARRSSTS